MKARAGFISEEETLERKEIIKDQNVKIIYKDIYNLHGAHELA